MAFLIVKSLHIVGFVAWFAGLFYLVRLFVYHRESWDKEESEAKILANQYGIMEWRLYKIICNPAMVITWTCGVIMLCIHGYDWFAENIWMHLKLGLLILLTGYHHSCKSMIKRLAKKELNWSSVQFRMYNEVPTLFLLAIVLLAVFKNLTNFILLFGSILIVAILLMVIVKSINRPRN